MSQPLTKKQQTDIVRLVVRAGMMLLQHGAECSLVEQMLLRLGKALGLESVEVAQTTHSIIVTGLYQGRCITTTRRFYDKGINMHIVCELQHLVTNAESHGFRYQQITNLLDRVEAVKYPVWQVIPMIGLSCAAFSRLFGGDWLIFLITFVASSAAMLIRIALHHRHHNPYVIFCCTAFIATTVASSAVTFQWGNQPQLALAASVLLLVPGFPLINAVSDMTKGYVINGVGRWFVASILSASVAAGIALSLAVTGIQGWL